MARDPRLPPPIPAVAAATANPYAAPQAVVDDVAPGQSHAETVRRAHVRHEVQIRSVGSLYYLSTFFMLIAGAGLLFSPIQVEGPAPVIWVGALYLVLGLAFGFLAHGFRRLRPWVRIPGAILSGLGLLAIPVGTLVNGWILYAMFSKKGRTILDPSYDAILRATPHIRYVRSLGDKIALGILLAMIAGIGLLIAWAMFSTR